MYGAQIIAQSDLKTKIRQESDEHPLRRTTFPSGRSVHQIQ